MSPTEAYRVARNAISDSAEIELAVVNGKPHMVPTKRGKDGKAVRAEDQEAADAYNWFATHPYESSFR